jgi:hypothetical protein
VKGSNTCRSDRIRATRQLLALLREDPHTKKNSDRTDEARADRGVGFPYREAKRAARSVVGARWLRVQAQQLGVRRVVSRPAGDASQDLERLVGEGKREKRVGREWGREGGRPHLIRRWRSARGWGRRRCRRGGLARLSGRGSGERRRKEEDARRLGRDDVRKRTRSTHSAFFFPFVFVFSLDCYGARPPLPTCATCPRSDSLSLSAKE